MNISNIYSDELPAFISEAIETPPILRLKDIGMNCGCEYTSFPRFADIDSYSRYEHSLGAALIVWNFTHDKAQTMAALLHDISTPAFSHVIDFLKGDYLTQEATEQGTEDFIKASDELLSLIERYGLSVDEVKDYHIYPIADDPSPRLSADRLEYTIGNMINYGFSDVDTAKELFDNITVGENEYGEKELVFKEKSCALRFGEYALMCSKVYVSDEDRYSMQILSEILRDALSCGAICSDDLNSTERQTIEKLKANEKTASRWRDYVNLKSVEICIEPQQEGEWRKICAKKRFIDPYILNVGRASKADTAFAKSLNDFIAQTQDHWVRGR